MVSKFQSSPRFPFLGAASAGVTDGILPVMACRHRVPARTGFAHARRQLPAAQLIFLQKQVNFAHNNLPRRSICAKVFRMKYAQITDTLPPPPLSCVTATDPVQRLQAMALVNSVHGLRVGIHLKRRAPRPFLGPEPVVNGRAVSCVSPYRLTERLPW